MIQNRMKSLAKIYGYVRIMLRKDSPKRLELMIMRMTGTTFEVQENRKNHTYCIVINVVFSESNTVY